MPKFRVTLNYCIWKTHVYELDIKPDEVEEFREDPCDFYTDKDEVEEWDGDVMNGTWEEVVEEISPLDQIVKALTECDDPHCIDGTSSDGRKDDGSKWEEGPHGDCDKCNGTGKILMPVGDNKE